jgi:hypothetical protein
MKALIYLTHQSAKPLPLAPLPQERGTRNLNISPLLLREKGLGDEGCVKYINAKMKG